MNACFMPDRRADQFADESVSCVRARSIRARIIESQSAVYR